VGLVRSFGLADYTGLDLETDMQLAGVAPLDPRLLHLSEALTVAGRESVAVLAASVMLADGAPSGDQEAVYRRICERLGLSEAHLKGVVAEVNGGAARR